MYRSCVYLSSIYSEKDTYGGNFSLQKFHFKKARNWKHIEGSKRKIYWELFYNVHENKKYVIKS